ncbi:hypothetical protein [Massilia pseudoviolaceinigra]|uniref:hypothetical protein n=1 Tax=Massilia pseudoviolaceinigra TaxID=3057165 RepID=UPI0027967773|nr:hypothetical protein [Massilia sp. CCM 9206]MDQ1921117.1 hypothetical protein [Massilia sp. CCM 9206]
MFASILAALAIATDACNAIPADAVQALQESRSAVLYSLEPISPEGFRGRTFKGYQLFGKTRIEGASYKIAADEFRNAATRSNGYGAACFDPRHAIEVAAKGHTFTFLLCYACKQMAVYRDGKMITKVDAAGSSKTLNRILTAAKVPLSTSYDETRQKGQNADSD